MAPPSTVELSSIVAPPSLQRPKDEPPLDTTPNDGLIADADRGAFLDALEAVIHRAAAEELQGTGWSAEHCPHIEYWFAYYRRRSAREIEAALRRYAPAAAKATTADEYLEPVVARVRAAIVRWRTTAEVDAPTHDMPPRDTSPAQASRPYMGRGSPLDSQVRTRMEHGFGRDLSSVRVHTGPEANLLARQHDARAVTMGTSIGFGNAQYRPGSLIGDLLIAHEIAHAVQQAQATHYAVAGDSRPDEAHADRAAGTAVARIAGIAEARPPTGAARGLALRRCKMSPVPREFDATNPNPETPLSSSEIERIDSQLKQVDTAVVKPSQVTC